MRLIRFFVLLLVLTTSGLSLQAQNPIHLMEISFEKDENIYIKKLASSEESSSFFIQVKDSVASHYHAFHTETLYVVSGEGRFIIDDKSMDIRPVDFIEIPKKAVHSVQVISKEPLKVLSVQAPEFIGKDRVFSPID